LLLLAIPNKFCSLTIQSLYATSKRRVPALELSSSTVPFTNLLAHYELAKGTNPNSTIYYSAPNKQAPRFWTAYLDLFEPTGSISFDLLALPETSAPISFNTHENNAPYLIYANRDEFTELYAQNHPSKAD
jgi:hypothetical protein